MSTSGASVEFGPLGFGAASIGNLYSERTEEQAQGALAAAWDGGIRYYDTAPHYGIGLSERRLGSFLRTKPRDEFVISTKVGRVLDPNPDFTGGSDLPTGGFAVPNTHLRRWDPTEAGIRRSLDDSLERLGLDRVDVLFLHDPDDYDLDAGIREALPALVKLRDEGIVKAIGVGVNSVATAARCVREGDLDVVMLAGRYTLLEQPALEEFFPVCEARGVRLVDAAVFNSGLLATSNPGADAHYNYSTVPADVLARAQALAEACREFGVELPAAALQFPGRHPLVATVVVGTANANSVRENVANMRADIPEALWAALIERGLIPA
ncbi:MAG TPA: aldo/keto reductase [Candidatus Lumbricidophila sp.]|nr:aldo/keto reductase [Candidatus Lumbricidophila sp.]